MTSNADGKVGAGLRRIMGAIHLACVVVAAVAVVLFLVVTLRFRDPTLHPDIVTGLLILGLGAVATWILLTVAWGRHWARWFLTPLLPGLVFPFVVGVFMMPVSAHVARQALPDGRTVHLTIAPIMTDTVYDLWLGSGLIWRRVDTELDYSEDGRIRDEKLALSRDGRRLLVARGGIWTDCVAICSDFPPCDLGLKRPVWNDADFEGRMRANSVEMAKLL